MKNTLRLLAVIILALGVQATLDAPVPHVEIEVDRALSPHESSVPKVADEDQAKQAAAAVAAVAGTEIGASTGGDGAAEVAAKEAAQVKLEAREHTEAGRASADSAAPTRDSHGHGHGDEGAKDAKEKPELAARIFPVNSSTKKRSCAVKPLSKATAAKIESAFKKTAARRAVVPALAVSITVHFHVATCPGRLPVTDRQIKEQLLVLNDRLSSPTLKLTFVLGTTNRVANPIWCTIAQGSGAEAAMKANRIGGALDLNIYLTSFTTDDLGWASTPDSIAAASAQSDGVVAHFGTLPGGSVAGYDKGLTLVHEVGHWLGLFHTWEGGCTPSGDLVMDTPPEAGPALECVARDTCNGDKKLDPINNYMDGTPDMCKNKKETGLTPGQFDRIRATLIAFRGA